MRISPLALLILSAPFAAAEDPKGFMRPVFRDGAPTEVKKAIEAAIPARLEAATKIAESLPALEADAAKAKKAGRNVDIRVTAEKVSRAKNRLKALNEDVGFLPKLDALPKVGAVAKPIGFTTKVKEILDKGGFVGQLRYAELVGKNPVPRTIDVIYLYPTQGLVDGSDVPLGSIVHVRGTRKLGASTLFEVEIVDPKKVFK